ncbi:IS6 family transposase [Roseovarius sp. 217]|uniref:IS6 family transposase n=1 Tax=Roseovarius sp. (strain 217) TaxID=314264 RepID=UPI000068552C|nr:IS6 family transposase [Roseovarius sp. 217]EAQ24894.1 putative IS6 family transposase [Roseovarius sp. 217]
MRNQDIRYKRHRFPPQIIAHVVWLYARFNLSFREVEELMLERGIDVSYETIRRWTVKFGPLIARTLRRRQPRPGDVWRLDEVVVKIAGRSFWLWRAVDQHGVVLEEILQPKRIITDKLRSYGAAKREVAPGLDHWSHKGLNNRAENNHLPFRKRERVMQGFRSPGALQRFVSIQSATRNCFSVPARRRSAIAIRYHRLEALEAWKIAANVA